MFHNVDLNGSPRADGFSPHMGAEARAEWIERPSDSVFFGRMLGDIDLLHRSGDG